MPLDIGEATRVVTKNFDRIHYLSDHLQKTNLYVYFHEMNLHRRIISIYETRKRNLDKGIPLSRSR